MPKGKGRKSDHIKPNEKPSAGSVQTDDLSPIDLGQDYVKPGETPRGNRSI